MSNQNNGLGKINEHIAELLRSVDRPGDYCVGGKMHVPMPRITVENIGDLSFPIHDVLIYALIDEAEQAPFGKGTETITDTSVRNCWQIDSSCVRISGSSWKKTFADLLNIVTDGLGLDRGQIGTELYKLLIYREGGFFAPHRDTEKVKGMIATLSISLPTPGEGGELSVRHLGQETIFDISSQEPSELSYASFYSDCLHEAHPVTKGHRVTLVYNLFIQSGKKWTGAPDYMELTDKVKESLVKWRDTGNSEKIVWLLEHSYSEEGLSFDTLKGTDMAVAQILEKAATDAKCAVFAAILSIQETGDPEFGWGPTRMSLL